MSHNQAQCTNGKKKNCEKVRDKKKSLAMRSLTCKRLNECCVLKSNKKREKKKKERITTMEWQECCVDT